MALIKPVVDGKIQETSASENSLSNAQKSDGSSLDKDAFLQLLVAQMKYQDPLEPTSNTEYISQFATFSELEQMQNLSASMDLYRASGLVGENVILSISGKNGSVNYVTGVVDYVEMEGGKAYLSVNGSLYSLDDLTTVVDPTYQAAFDQSNALLTALYKLPALSALTVDYKDQVLAIRDTYEGMNEYEQSFFTDDETSLIKQYIKKMEELMLAAGITEPEKEEPPTMEDLFEDLFDRLDKLAGSVAAGGAGSGSTGSGAAGGVEESGGTESGEGAESGSGSVEEATDPDASGNAAGSGVTGGGSTTESGGDVSDTDEAAGGTQQAESTGGSQKSGEESDAGSDAADGGDGGDDEAQAGTE